MIQPNHRSERFGIRSQSSLTNDQLAFVKEKHVLWMRESTSDHTIWMRSKYFLKTYVNKSRSTNIRQQQRNRSGISKKILYMYIIFDMLSSGIEANILNCTVSRKYKWKTNTVNRKCRFFFFVNKIDTFRKIRVKTLFLWRLLNKKPSIHSTVKTQIVFVNLRLA